MSLTVIENCTRCGKPLSAQLIEHRMTRHPRCPSILIARHVPVKEWRNAPGDHGGWADQPVPFDGEEGQP